MSRLDALIEAIPPPRRFALQQRLHGTGPFARAARDWVTAADGVEVCWVLADWCRRQLPELPRWSDARTLDLTAIGQLIGARVHEHPDGPTVWIELFAAIPNHKPLIARELLAPLPITPAVLQAIRRGLTTLAIPHRRLLATRLRASGTLDPELAVTWFADPTLRGIAEEYFTPGVAAHEARLRERLETAKQGEREAIVRVLRRVDPKLTLTGTHDASTDGELQARLRERPDDEMTAEVWADSLIDRQDPRGELIALELALRRADPERALELSRAQAAHLAMHRKAVWNKPGGFPFREKYRGRSAIAFVSDWDHTMRGKSENVFDRVQSFVEAVTTVRAPRRVYFGRRLYPPAVPPAAAGAPGELARDVIAALGGDAIAMGDGEGKFVVREQVATPIADVDAFRAICTRERLFTLEYTFLLTWPYTDVPLPHQEGEHYAGGAALVHSLAIFVSGRDLRLQLTFPFESTSDPQFVAVHEACCETLGRVFTASRWLALEPSADGKKLLSKRFRFTAA